MSKHYEILIEDARWRRLRPAVAEAVEFTLKDQKLKKASLNLLLSDDAEIKKLNRDYRAKNKPTNVLSFPNGELISGVRELGDVILSYDTIAREAKEQGKTIKDHVTHLVIHGILHLLGHDHMNDRDAKRMETIEIAILARMGIANPYESA